MACFELYLSKLNTKRDDLWQKPKKSITGLEPEWYENVVIGRDPLNEAMKNLSENAKLSRIYTNHCIQATTVTNLNKKGFEARDIMATTGHKSETSIKTYASRCPTKKRRKMCDALAEKLIDNPTDDKNCEKKEEIKNTPKMPAPQNQNETEFEDLELPDNQIIDILTQIKKENEQFTKAPTQPENPNIPNTSVPNLLNVSNVSNVANVAKNQMVPPMYFSNSTVTINYNYYAPK